MSDDLKRKLRAGVTKVVERLQPVARVAERVANIAVHVQKPTVMGVVGMAGTALSAMSDALGNSKTPGHVVHTLVSKGQLVEALDRAGARILVTKHPDGTESVRVQALGAEFYLDENGTILTTSGVEDAFREWLRQAIDRVLPFAVEIRTRQSRTSGALDGNERHEAVPLKLTQYDNEQAVDVLRSTLPLIEGGRCILLDGRPGVGKTTMAKIIAREANLGRTVLLESAVLGSQMDDHSVSATSGPGGGDLREALALLSPGVAIVDDVDKVHVQLYRLEALRSAARLVILTANNGQYDEVLDGAMMRAGRVDEVFTIMPSKLERSAPFDRLSDEEWEEVCQWPIAYLNEVRKRLAARPGELRLDDLRARLKRRTRSGEELH